MRQPLSKQILEFGRTIRLSHSLFALPFGLGAALVAEPPCPDGWSLALLVACMVTARTAAMGINRVADAPIDARNPRTAGRAIPAGRLSRAAALAMALVSGAAFIALAWLFLPLRGNPWPGILAPAFLLVLAGYSWTKRFTVLSHWILGLCLGLAPVGAWIALMGCVAAWPVVLGAAVMFWTAGFDILYAMQDTDVDRRERLFSVPAGVGESRAKIVAAASHAAAVALLVAAFLIDRATRPAPVMGWASAAAMAIIAGTLAMQHWNARRKGSQALGDAVFPANAAVSMIWLAGVIADVAM